MKHFEPLRMYLSPFLTAVVRIPETSEPASASVRQNGASLKSSASTARYFSFPCWAPPIWTGAEARPLQAIEVPMPLQPQPSSSSISVPSRNEAPGPPYSSWTWLFINPSSQALRSTSSGQVPSLSYSQATGRISFSAKSCAISRNAFCSSVSVKSTTFRCLLLTGADRSQGPTPVNRLTGQSTKAALKGSEALGGRQPPADRHIVTNVTTARGSARRPR